MGGGAEADDRQKITGEGEMGRIGVECMIWSCMGIHWLGYKIDFEVCRTR